MVDKTKLQDVINSLIGAKDDQARTIFHDYMTDKTKEFIKNHHDTKNSDLDTDHNK